MAQVELKNVYVNIGAKNRSEKLWTEKKNTVIFAALYRVGRNGNTKVLSWLNSYRLKGKYCYFFRRSITAYNDTSANEWSC